MESRIEVAYKQERVSQMVYGRSTDEINFKSRWTAIGGTCLINDSKFHIPWKYYRTVTYVLSSMRILSYGIWSYARYIYAILNCIHEKKNMGCHVAKRKKKRNVKLINSMCHGSRDRYTACLYSLGKWTQYWGRALILNQLPIEVGKIAFNFGRR